MRWALSPDQTELAGGLRGWLDHHAPTDVVRRHLDDGTGSSLEDKLLGEGWLHAGVAEEHGGAGGGLVELAVMAAELGRAAAPSGRWTAGAVAAGLLTVPAVADAVLATLDGDIGSAAVGVPSDRIPSGRTGLRLRDGAVEGRTRLVLGGTDCRHVVLPVRDGDRTRLAVVDAGATGCTRTPRRPLDRSRDAADLAFDAAPATVLDVPDDAVHAALDAVAAHAAVLVAADSLGASERMLALAVAYSLQRTQFGVPIGSFQAVKHAAAEVLVGIEAARSITFYAAASVAQGHPERALHAAVAKARSTRSGTAAADATLTMHGAIGYTWEHDLQLFYKRAKLDVALFGDPDAWDDRVADALCLAPSTA